MAVTRKRKNTIHAIQLEYGSWESDAQKKNGLFVSHFRIIYTKVNSQSVLKIYPDKVFQGIEGIPQAASSPGCSANRARGVQDPYDVGGYWTENLKLRIYLNLNFNDLNQCRKNEEIA